MLGTDRDYCGVEKGCPCIITIAFLSRVDKRLTEAVKVHQEGNIESAIKMYKQLLRSR